MRRLKGLGLLASVIGAWLAGAPVQAAEKTFTWSDELCEYKLRYDPARTPEAQLRDTTEFLYGEAWSSIPILVSPSTPEAIGRLDPAAFAAECAGTLRRLDAMDLLPLPGLAEYRATKRAQIQDACAFGHVQAKGFRDPAALRAYAPAASCGRFVDALEGKSDARALWRETIEKTCANNSDPARCKANQYAKERLPNGMAWIRLYLTSFGWGNCAVTFMAANAPGSDSRMAAAREAFRTRFKPRNQCDE